MAYDKIVDSGVLDGKLTAIADAIRTKGGTTGELEFPDGFVSAVEGIQTGGGGDELALDIIDRSITGISSNELTRIGAYAFHNCAALANVHLPKVSAIGDSAFEGCTALTHISFPGVTTDTVGFRGNAFKNCSNLKSIDFPNAIGSIWMELFCGCKSLTDVNIPKWVDLPSYLFSRCESLEKLDLPSVAKINTVVFEGCTNLNLLILRNTTLVTLVNVNAFNGTPFASGGTGGTVYCPAELIAQYQQATNWATLYAAGTCNFVAIEGSEYE